MNKKSKRSNPILALGLALALLTGCAAAPDQSSNTATAETAATATATAAAAPLRKLACGDDKSYYYPQQMLSIIRSRVMCVDYAAQTLQPLCSAPGCTHEDATCPAVQLFGEYGSPYVLDDDRLLYFPQDLDACTVGLAVSDRLGQNMTTITDVAEDLFNNMGSVFYTDGQTLYAITYGENYTYPLRAYDLTTGAARTVTELGVSGFIQGSVGRSLVIKKEHTDADSGELTGVDLVLVDVDTGAQTPLRHYAPSGLTFDTDGYGYSTAVLDGQLYEYSYADGTLAVTDLPDGEPRTLVQQMPADPNDERGTYGTFRVDLVRVLDGYLEVQYNSTTWDYRTADYLTPTYLVDLQTGEVREKTALPTQEWNGYGHRPEVWAQTADQLLVTCRTEAYTVTDIGADGAPYTYQSWHYYLGLISVRDYLAGTPNYTELGMMD